jgi:hypothetical protein
MGASHRTGNGVAEPEGASASGPRIGSPPMAVTGHPSGEAHKRPQYIVMRYNGHELLCRLYRAAIYRNPRTTIS